MGGNTIKSLGGGFHKTEQTKSSTFKLCKEMPRFFVFEKCLEYFIFRLFDIHLGVDQNS